MNFAFLRLIRELSTVSTGLTPHASRLHAWGQHSACFLNVTWRRETGGGRMWSPWNASLKANRFICWYWFSSVFLVISSSPRWINSIDIITTENSEKTFPCLTKRKLLQKMRRNYVRRILKLFWKIWLKHQTWKIRLLSPMTKRLRSTGTLEYIEHAR